jgi:hypothetical protein
MVLIRGVPAANRQQLSEPLGTWIRFSCFHVTELSAARPQFRQIDSSSLVRFRARRLVPHTQRILARRNASSANLQRPATVSTQRHAIKYTIGFVHGGDYRLDGTWGRMELVDVVVRTPGIPQGRFDETAMSWDGCPHLNGSGNGSLSVSTFIRSPSAPPMTCPAITR